MRITCWLGSAVFVTLCGCGESNKEVIDRYAAQLQQRRDAMAQIAALLPPVGSVKQNRACPPLDPPLVAWTSSSGDFVPANGNADWVKVEELTDPLIYHFGGDKFNLLVHSAVLETISFSDPKSVHYAGKTSEYAEKHAKLSQLACDCRYVVVVRVVEVTEPEVAASIDPDGPISYADGEAVLEGFVCDLVTPKVLGEFRVTATPSLKETTISYQKGGSATSKLKERLESALRWKRVSR